MSSLPPRSTKKLFTLVLVLAVTGLLAASLSQTVESAGGPMRSATQKQGRGVIKVPEDQPSKSRRFPNIDIRTTAPQTMSAIATANAGKITQRLQARKVAVDQALNRLRTFSRGAQAKASPLTGAIEVLRSTTGALSGPASGRNAEDVVHNFLSANSDLYGLSSRDLATLRFTGESVSGGSGMRMVRVEQVVNGLPVFQSETRFILDAQGRVFRSTGLIIPNATVEPLEFGGLIPAQAALHAAMNSVEIETDTTQATLANANVDGTEVEVVANNPNITSNVT